MSKAPEATPPELKSIADEFSKSELPVAAVAVSAVEKGAEMADPIYQVLKQTLTPANIGKVIDQAVPIINAATKTVVGTITATGDIVSSLGTVVGKISDDATKIISKDGVALCKVAKEAIKDISDNFAKVGIALIGAWSTSVKELGKTVRDVVDKTANVVEKGLDTYSNTKRMNTIKSIVKYAIIGVIVVAIIIVIAVVATRPKKMTNNMSTPIEFDQNYNPEAQSCFTEKEYKYYNELVI
jgi:hypothetical protein